MSIGIGIKKGTAELAILSVLEDGPLHGYELSRRIKKQTRGALSFSLAALYPMLYRMEQRRWIRGAWETSCNGRQRRCYRLTAPGKEKALAAPSRMVLTFRRASTAHEGVQCLIGGKSFTSGWRIWHGKTMTGVRCLKRSRVISKKITSVSLTTAVQRKRPCAGRLQM